MNKELEETEENTILRVKSKVNELFDYVVNVKVLIDLIEHKNKQIKKLTHDNRTMTLEILELKAKIEEIELENQVLQKRVIDKESNRYEV